MEQDMKTKKFKWPKFLTLKRMVLILLVVCAGIIALVYFCGGYDPAKALQHESVFDKEGFEHYNDALKMETELAEGILEDAKSNSVKLNEKLEGILNASVPVELVGSDLSEWYGVIEDSRFKEELALYGNYIRKARASLESLKNSYSTTKAVANIQNFLQLSGNCDESFLLVEADIILGEYEYYIQLTSLYYSDANLRNKRFCVGGWSRSRRSRFSVGRRDPVKSSTRIPQGDNSSDKDS